MTALTILFPTDFSEPASQALETAAVLARHDHARLHLFHAVVLETPYVVPTDGAAPILTPDELLDEKESGARGRLESARRAAEELGLQVETALRRGENAADTILSYAEECAPDLIVLSSHGRKGLRRLLLGSVAEEVVRHSPCPVLVLRRDPGIELPSPASRVLAAVDFSPPSAKIVKAARSLAASLGGELDLLHVLHVPSSMEGASEATPFGPVGPVRPAGLGHEERLEQSEELLQRTYEDAGGPEVTVRSFVRTGNPAKEILEHAEQNHAGIIVLGTEGQAGLSRALFGSVCESVLREAPCPVHVVPAGAASAH